MLYRPGVAISPAATSHSPRIVSMRVAGPLILMTQTAPLPGFHRQLRLAGLRGEVELAKTTVSARPPKARPA